MAERAYLSPAEMDAAESQDFREFNPIPSSGVLERISAECVRLLHAPERICAVCGEFVQILDAADVKTVRRDQLPKETARLLSCDNPRTNWSDELKRQYCAHSTVRAACVSV